MSFLSNVDRYWQTVRHLRPVQIYGRLSFILRRPKPDLSETPVLAVVAGFAQAPARRAKCMSGPRSFCLLNRPGDLQQSGWAVPERELLWLYNLHYFDDLNAAEASERIAWHEALLCDWVSNNPPGCEPGWSPYPTSLRIVNWLKWHMAGNRLPTICHHSLGVQVRWLTKRLEWHLLGNHLYSNAKALVFAGLAFDGHEAQTWLNQGLALLRREISEQILPDGGNFERSTMYHVLATEDLLDLINAARAWPIKIDDATVTFWEHMARRMLAWLTTMLHPDREISLFNDGAIGLAPTPDEIFAYADRLGIAYQDDMTLPQATRRSTQLVESGYVRLEDQDAVAILDVAPVGPDYLPGHAHADTLSFELSLFGQRLVVNGGTSLYGTNSVRQRERSTKSHSTVEIDGQNSSEVWAGFRVARRAYPFGLSFAESDESLDVSCAHDGYLRLPGSPVHSRQWRISNCQFEVADRIIGGFSSATGRYIIHPDVEAAEIGPNAYRLTLPKGQVIDMSIVSGRGRLEPAHYAPEFGKILSTVAIAVDFSNGAADVTIGW
jgi:uncharacterized heparinase superfamily protein